jgi:hypothetical protein
MQDMRNDMQDTVADLRARLALADEDGPRLAALQEIVRAARAILETQATTIVAVTSIIAVEPGNRYVVGFANDALEAAGAALNAVAAIDLALDTLLVPLSERYEAVAHSVKVPA